MPRVVGRLKVGPMTMAVRNSARLMITALGGLCCRPSAVRSRTAPPRSARSEVVIITMDGASDSTVSRPTIWTTRSVRPAPVPRSMFSAWASGDGREDQADHGGARTERGRLPPSVGGLRLRRGGSERAHQATGSGLRAGLAGVGLDQDRPSPSSSRRLLLPSKQTTTSAGGRVERRGSPPPPGGAPRRLGMAAEATPAPSGAGA